MMVFAESELWFAQSSMSWAISMLSCFRYSASTLWTNFTDILCMHKSFVKLRCTDDVLIPTSCVLLSSWAISWIVTWQSSMSIRRTILISSCFAYLSVLCSPQKCSYVWNRCTAPWSLFCLSHHRERPAESSGCYEFEYHRAFGKTWWNISARYVRYKWKSDEHTLHVSTQSVTRRKRCGLPRLKSSHIRKKGGIISHAKNFTHAALVVRHVLMVRTLHLSSPDCFSS